MAVLLTRAPEENARIALKLRDLDVESLCWPLSRIELTTAQVEVPRGTEALILTSTNGIRAFAAQSTRRDVPVICVGLRTAEIAQGLGFGSVTCAGTNVAALAAWLQSHDIRRLFYPRAREISRDIRDLLPGDFVLEEQIVYSAEPTGPPESHVAESLVNGRIAAISIWSRRNACLLAKYLTENPHMPMNRLDLVAISENAAQPLGNSGFRHIITPETPNAEAMIATLSAALRQDSSGR